MSKLGAGRVGSPGKITDERIRRFAQYIRAGHFRTTAANLAGINVNTFYQWMRLGEELQKKMYDAAAAGEPPPPFTNYQRRVILFYSAIQVAEAEAESDHLEKLKSLAEEAHDWKAYKWVMEKRFPKTWGKTDPGGGNRMFGGGNNGSGGGATVIAAEGKIVIADGGKEGYIEALRRAQPAIPAPTITQSIDVVVDGVQVSKKDDSVPYDVIVDDEDDPSDV
jgi:hypothetical protein